MCSNDAIANLACTLAMRLKLIDSVHIARR
jgi:hypothetical protein